MNPHYKYMPETQIASFFCMQVCDLGPTDQVSLYETDSEAGDSVQQISGKFSSEGAEMSQGQQWLSL